jgi:hypothetical protein
MKNEKRGIDFKALQKKFDEEMAQTLPPQTTGYMYPYYGGGSCPTCGHCRSCGRGGYPGPYQIWC